MVNACNLILNKINTCIETEISKRRWLYIVFSCDFCCIVTIYCYTLIYGQNLDNHRDVSDIAAALTI